MTATGQARGIAKSQLGFFVAAIMTLPRDKPVVSPKSQLGFFVAAIMTLHGASPWYRQISARLFCSGDHDPPRGEPVVSLKSQLGFFVATKHDPPRDKPVVSPKSQLGFFVAAIMTLHGTSPWYHQNLSSAFL